MTADLRIDHYDWTGGREAMLRFGPDDGPVVVVAPPLFEEANRTRALIVAVLRGLAARGIGGTLPDLPGQGESLADLAGATLPHWCHAFATAASLAGGRRYVVAIRGGALVESEAEAIARLYLSPVDGATLVRDLLRARRAASIAAGEPPAGDDPAAPGPPLLLAGNLIGRDLLQGLMVARPEPAERTLTLFPDSLPADRALAPDRPPNRDGDLPRYRRPWTASEPLADLDLAEALADDIAAWVRRCED